MGCILKGGGGLYSRLIVGAVLLAAGSGSRLGNRPKSMLELGGVPLIRRQLIALSGAGVDEVVVVLGHHASLIEPVVQAFPVSLARNMNPDAGQASSVRVGLEALSGKLDAVVVALADQPMLSSQDFVDLIAAYKKRADGIDFVMPVVDGQPGNPMVFSERVRQEILTGEGQVACRQWRAQNAHRIEHFDTSNRRYCVDIDTPQDIEKFEQDTGHVLRWGAVMANTQAQSDDDVRAA